MPEPDDSSEPAAASSATEPTSPPYPPWQSIKARVSADLPDEGGAPARKDWTDLVDEDDEAPKRD